MIRPIEQSLALGCLLVFALPSIVGAQERDPFSTDDSTVSTAEKEPKREKVVIHTPTLDLCFTWFEMNLGLVEIQKKIKEAKSGLESVDQDPQGHQREELQDRITQLQTAYETTRQKLDRIPLDFTFDLERWQQFKQQLEQMRMQEAERRHLRDHLSRENDRLRAENVKLREEVERLKRGQ